MRLAFTFLIASISALTLPHYGIPIGAEPMQISEQRKIEHTTSIPDKRHPLDFDINRDRSMADVRSFWRATKRLSMFVLFGWLAGRILIPYRRLIALFMGVALVAYFLLVQLGIVEFTIRTHNLEKIFHTLKMVIWSIGPKEVIAIILGSWAGVSGFLSADKRRQMQIAEDFLAKDRIKRSKISQIS